ncbi:MAG: hypothetical protein V7L05_10690 [Nostoc sp.]|uniref:hypothetical protein n=1 Tax=Nostoc sp. TaxID=1180 RepID=UPI002FFC26A6
MSNINNQTQDLYSVELVQDLDHEAAATVTGGTLYISTDANAQGSQLVLGQGYTSLGGYNNKVSWYQTTNEGWYAYTGENYTGQSYYLPPNTSGNLSAYANDTWQSAQPASQSAPINGGHHW